MTEFLTKATAVENMPKDVKAPTHVIRGRSRSDARLRMIRVLQEIKPGSYIYETRIYSRFTSKRTEREIREVLDEFLSKGYIYRLGTGKRGSPFKIVLSKAWPHNRCPFCGHVEHPATPLVDIINKAVKESSEEKS
jgi:hypothetical protein